MVKLKSLVEKIKRTSKTKYVIILMLIVLGITVSFPTLARYKNRLDVSNILNSTGTWDGTIATSYHKGTGTQTDPYIIANAKELAYFSTQLQSNSYENTYFKLSNDIVINNGTFNYVDGKITYLLSESTFYVKNYTTDIYDNIDTTGTKITSINKLTPLSNFKGHFDGDYHSIYGLYVTDESSEELGLFTNLSGTVENLYIENAMIYGGNTTAAVSTATSSTLKNIFVSGNIVGTQSAAVDRTISGIANYSKRKTKTPLSETITLPTTEDRPLKSLRLLGTYTSVNTAQNIMINGIEVAPGDFEIDLGSTPITEITLEIDSTTASTIALKDMLYEVIYKDANASGIVAKATDTTLTNVINKANIYSDTYSAGLVGYATNLTINNAYNTGIITGVNTASGIISTIEDSTTATEINRVYNTGALAAPTTSSFVHNITGNTSVAILNTFNLATSTKNLTTDQDLTLTNVLDINTATITGIETITEDKVKDKTYTIQTLGYTEYVDTANLITNENAVWIYEQGNLPILHIDDLNDPIAVLNIGTYNWEDIGYELDNVYFGSTTAFMISSKNSNETITASYYIHEGETSLTRQEIEAITTWTEYTEIVPLNKEGYYTVYVKATDPDGNTKYINSERLVIDLTAPNATITMNDLTWNSLNSDLTNQNISDTTNITITAEDTYSEINEVKYYISNIYLTEEELKELSADKWIDYTQAITINSKGTYIVNAKVTDARNHTTYLNTDYIVFGGYEQTITLGRNNQSVEKVNITNASQVTYNFTYPDQTAYQEGYTNNIITDISLPINTKITLINNNTNEVYTYKVTTSLTKIPLNLFTKVGQTDDTVTFNDQAYINETTKNISLLFDFKEANITENIAINAYIEMQDASNKIILSTLKATVKPINIYPNSDVTLSLTKTTPSNTINFNSDSTTEITLETALSYKQINEETIYDTTTENKKLGLAIKLVDSNNQLVAKKYLKNIRFKLGENYYSPDNDGIVRIKLSDNLEKVVSTLTIETYATSTQLETGNYNFVITPFIASDGKYTDDLSATSINIPVTTTKQEEMPDYGFNVTMDESNKVIYKSKETTTMNFSINEKSNFTASTVRVSLYKKKSLTAYDQTYEIINLQDYVIDSLTKSEDNVYYVTSDKLSLSLNTTKFEKTGYELRFELYDGTKKITTIKKKFIVR